MSLAFFEESRHPNHMRIKFDFRFHIDRSGCVGTQYFELVPGPYRGAHWAPGARFIHEYTFCLFERIFERRVPDYDHFAFVDVPLSHWEMIITDLATLRKALARAAENEVEIPFGSTLRVEEAFRADLADNRRRLAALLAEVERWLCEKLRDHDCISVLGL
jgi:hypothetical protein